MAPWAKERRRLQRPQEDKSRLRTCGGVGHREPKISPSPKADENDQPKLPFIPDG